MKLAEEWVLSLDVVGGAEQAIRTVRRIQADALRYAANMSGEIKNVKLLEEADELDGNLDTGHR